MPEINPDLPDLFHIETDDSFNARLRHTRRTGQNPPLGTALCGKRSADVVNYGEARKVQATMPDAPDWAKCCPGCLWTLKTMMEVA